MIALKNSLLFAKLQFIIKTMNCNITEEVTGHGWGQWSWASAGNNSKRYRLTCCIHSTLAWVHLPTLKPNGHGRHRVWVAMNSPPHRLGCNGLVRCIAWMVMARPAGINPRRWPQVLKRVVRITTSASATFTGPDQQISSWKWAGFCQ